MIDYNTFTLADLEFHEKICDDLEYLIQFEDNREYDLYEEACKIIYSKEQLKGVFENE